MDIFIYILKSLRESYKDQLDNKKSLPLVQKDLFGNKHFIANANDIAPGVSLVRIYEALKLCNDIYFDIKQFDYEARARFIEMPDMDKSNRTLSFTLNKNLVPAFESLTHGHIQVRLKALSELRFNAKRILILMSQHSNRGKILIHAKRFRNMLGLNESYSNFSHFKKHVIDKAQKQIHELFIDGKSDLYFVYDKEESKSKFGDEWERMLVFKVVAYNNDKRLENTDKPALLESDDYKMVCYCLNIIYDNNEKYRRILINHVYRNMDQNSISLLCNRLNKLSTEVPLKNNDSVQKLISKIMKEDFGYITNNQKNN